MKNASALYLGAIAAAIPIVADGQTHEVGIVLGRSS
jgi:hypothetical protein